MNLEKLERKINIQKALAFLYANNGLSKRKIKKQISFIIATKKVKQSRIKFNQGGQRLVVGKL